MKHRVVWVNAQQPGLRFRQKWGCKGFFSLELTTGGIDRTTGSCSRPISWTAQQAQVIQILSRRMRNLVGDMKRAVFCHGEKKDLPFGREQQQQVVKWTVD